MSAVSQGQASIGMMPVQVTGNTWKRYMVLGIVLVVTGGFAMVFPLGTAYGIEFFVGVLLSICGAAYLINAFASRKHGFVWQLLLALIYLGVGIMLLVYPLSGVVTLTLVLGIILGILILASWPDSSAWVIGLLVGIDLLFAGMTMIMLALAARNPGSMAMA